VSIERIASYETRDSCIQDILCHVDIFYKKFMRHIGKYLLNKLH